jgi:hypothetical protein
MITPADYETYWLHAAQRNNAIAHTDESKHFTTYNVEDALTELKNIKYPLLALEEPEYRIADGLSDNTRLPVTGAILILKRAKAGDYKEIREATQSTFPIAFQMITKLRNDRKRANDSGIPSPENMVKHLDLNTIRMVMVGPVFDGCYGWRVEFTINSPANMNLDESQWTGETKWKF